MTNDAAPSGAGGAKPKSTYLPRLMPVGAAIILLMILVPMLREGRRKPFSPAAVEPPLAMSLYSTGHARLDSLANEGLRHFGRREYERAARFLAEAHFHWNVRVREGVAERYPEDLRFYLGLAHFYRGRPEQGAPLIEEEELGNPFGGKYPWFLANVYFALGRKDAGRAKLERAAALGEAYAPEARAALEALGGVTPSGSNEKVPPSP